MRVDIHTISKSTTYLPPLYSSHFQRYKVSDEKTKVEPVTFNDYNELHVKEDENRNEKLNVIHAKLID